MIKTALSSWGETPRDNLFALQGQVPQVSCNGYYRRADVACRKVGKEYDSIWHVGPIRKQHMHGIDAS